MAFFGVNKTDNTKTRADSKVDVFFDVCVGVCLSVCLCVCWYVRLGLCLCVYVCVRRVSGCLLNCIKRQPMYVCFKMMPLL